MGICGDTGASAAATGGSAVVVFLLSTSVNPTVSRATLVALLLATDIDSAILAGSHGLLALDTFLRSGLFLIPLYLGISLGSRQLEIGKVQSV